MAFTGQLATADSKLANIELGGPVTLTSIPTYPRVVFEVNWTDNPTAADVSPYTDLSTRVRAFSSGRGRPTQFNRVEAGTATLTLDNRDGYLNPDVANRLLMRRARLSAYYDHTMFPVISGHIESYHYEYPGVDMDAVCVLTIAEGQKVLALQQFPTSFVREGENTSTRLETVLAEAGVPRANQDVWSTTIDNSSNLAPVRVIQTEATVQTRAVTIANADATVTLTSGTTDGLSAGMSVTGPGVPSGTTILSITDSTHFEMSANAVLTTDIPVTGTPNSTVLSGDMTNISVGMTVGPETNSNGQQVYGSASPWTATVTAIQGSSATINPATRDVTFRGAGEPGGTVTTTFTASTAQTLSFPKTYLQVTGILEHIREIEATERGLLVVEPDGTYFYQGVDYRPAQSVQVTFGEQGSEIPYIEVPIDYDDTGVANEYVLRNTYNNTETTVTDATSQARYFRRVQQIDQIWAGNITSLPTEQRAFEPLPRLQGVGVKPAANPLTLWRPLLSLDVSDKVSVRRRPGGGADFFAAYDQFIEGISHTANPSDWTITFVTSPERT